MYYNENKDANKIGVSTCLHVFFYLMCMATYTTKPNYIMSIQFSKTTTESLKPQSTKYTKQTNVNVSCRLILHACTGQNSTSHNT